MNFSVVWLVFWNFVGKLLYDEHIWQEFEDFVEYIISVANALELKISFFSFIFNKTNAR